LGASPFRVWSRTCGNRSRGGCVSSNYFLKSFFWTETSEPPAGGVRLRAGSGFHFGRISTGGSRDGRAASFAVRRVGTPARFRDMRKLKLAGLRWSGRRLSANLHTVRNRRFVSRFGPETQARVTSRALGFVCTGPKGSSPTQVRPTPSSPDLISRTGTRGCGVVSVLRL